jgi:hypothetical protein
VSSNEHMTCFIFASYMVGTIGYGMVFLQHMKMGHCDQ